MWLRVSNMVYTDCGGNQFVKITVEPDIKLTTLKNENKKTKTLKNQNKMINWNRWKYIVLLKKTNLFLKNTRKLKILTFEYKSVH